MSAVGVVFIGFGMLAVWGAFHMANVFDVLRSIVGAPIPARTDVGALKQSGTQASTKSVSA